jgi:hypothetical protein
MCIGTHPYIPVANTAEVRLFYATPGGVAENVLNFEKGSAWTAEELDALAATVRDAWETNISTVTSNATSLSTVVATDLSSETGPQATNVAGIAGALSSVAMPQNVTLAIKFSTALRGRSFRGRMFFVGLTDGQIEGDQLTVGSLATLLTKVGDFFHDIEGSSGTPSHVVVSRCADGVWRTTGVTTPVTAYSADRTVDTMKKRLLGHGI